MAAIASSDVSYSVTDSKKKESSRLENLVTVSFGDGSLTYPSGGVALTGTKLGLPAGNIYEVLLNDPGSSDGYLYKYDVANKKVRIYQGPASSGPLSELGSAATPTSSLKVVAIGW